MLVEVFRTLVCQTLKVLFAIVILTQINDISYIIDCVYVHARVQYPMYSLLYVRAIYSIFIILFKK